MNKTGGNVNKSSVGSEQADTLRNTILSSGQKRLWTLDKILKEKAAYNLFKALGVEGEFKPDVLEVAVQKIIERHDILRTAYIENEDGPKANIQSTIALSIKNIDLRKYVYDAQSALFHEILKKEVHKAFNLSTPPLFRLTYYKLTDNFSVLLFVGHHINFDAVSQKAFVTELGQNYMSLLLNKNINRPPLKQQFNTWAEEDCRKNEKLDTGYWKTLLSDATSRLNLPRNNNQGSMSLGKNLYFNFQDDLSNDITQYCRTMRMSPYAFLFTAYQLLIHKYTQQHNFIIGTPTSGLNERPNDELIGYFVNTLPIVWEANDNSLFSDAAKKLFNQVLTGMENCNSLDFAMSQLKSKNNSYLDFESLFIYNPEQESLQLGHTKIKDINFDSGFSRYDISIEVSPSAQGLKGFIQYKTDLFEPEFIEQFRNHFINVCKKVCANPLLRINDVSLHTEAEFNKIIHQWNNTSKEYPKDKLLHKRIEDTVVKYPQRIALFFEDQQTTYKQLNDKSNQLAHFLKENNVLRNQAIAVHFERSLEMIVALLAVLKVGAAYLPISPDDPADRNGYILQHAKVNIILTTEHLKNELPETSKIICINYHKNNFSNKSSLNLNIQSKPDDLAYIIFTSGSTGRPKGVMIEHQAICNRLDWMQDTYNLNKLDCVLQKTPYSFDVSVWEFFWPLMIGSKLVLAKPNGHKDPEYLAETISEHNVTTMHFVPSMLSAFIEIVEEKLPSLRQVFSSGEVLPVKSVTDFYKKWPDCKLHNLYGPTEASIDVTAWECTISDSKKSNIPIGFPIANMQTYILDQNMQPTPPRIKGEIYLGGIGLSRGYISQPELTSEYFIENTLTPEISPRLYKTGDLGLFNYDGSIEYCGRADFQVKIRGFRIELGEIENQICELDYIKNALAMVVNIDESDKHLLVFYQTTPEYIAKTSINIKPDKAPLKWKSFIKVNLDVNKYWNNTLKNFKDHSHTETLLKIHAGKNLPHYMLAKHFIMIDDFPLHNNGKINRKALKNIYIKKLYHGDLRNKLLQIYEEPQSDIEKSLAVIWESVLGITPIGRNDNFFQNGGDSINAIQMVSRAKKQGINIEAFSVFEHQTLEKLAHQAIQGIPKVKNIIKPDAVENLWQKNQHIIKNKYPSAEDAYALAPFQRHLLREFTEHHTTGLNITQQLLELSIPINIELIIKAWRVVLDHHPGIRVSFDLSLLDTPIQVVHKDYNIAIPCYDLSNLPVDKQVENIEETCKKFTHKGMQLTQTPQWKFALFQLGNNRHYMYWSFHYMSHDGWSTSFLAGDFFTAYRALLNGQKPKLKMARPFKDFIKWLEVNNKDDSSKVFWQSYLGKSPEKFHLSQHITKQPKISSSSVYRKQFISLTYQQTSVLKDFCKINSVTLSTLIHACWAIVLARTCNKTDLVFGSIMSGRPSELLDVENMIGHFNNLLPFRIKLDTSQSLKGWLTQIQNDHISVRNFQNTSIVDIGDWCNFNRATDLFDNFVVFENFPKPDHMQTDFEKSLPDPEMTSLAQIDLPLRVEVFPDPRLFISLSYQSKVFNHPDITNMLKLLNNILAKMVTSPNESLSVFINL